MEITKRLVKGQAITPQEYDDTIDYLDKRPDGQVYPSSSDTGLKLDHNAPGWGWDDITGTLHTDFNTPGTSPDFVAYNGNLKARQFDVNDEAFIELHMPHDYAIGTDIFVHLHWSHNSLTVTSGAPTFVVEGTYAKGHNQAAFGTPISVTLTEDANPTRFQHMVTEAQFSNAGGVGGLLDTSLLEPDGIFLLRVALTGNSIDDGSKPFVHFCDLHYQTTGLPTKNKNPNFYGV
jgi:hypothetical protein